MTELILFYGLLSMAVGLGVAYSLFPYRRRLHGQGGHRRRGKTAH